MSGRISEFTDRGCDVLGVGTDTIETHRRWLTTLPDAGGLGPIQFALASDPSGDVCRQYGVYVERQHLALRGVFIIDPNGVLQYQLVHSLSIGRSSDELLRVLDALQSGGLCPGERQIGEAPIDVATSLGPGRVIGSYEIESELGSGSFGTVFKAQDLLLKRLVALKVLKSTDDTSTANLLTEARAAAALNHPNVCMVHSVDTSHGAAVIVMEHVEGQPLSTLLKAGALPEASVAEFGRQISAGMCAAHAAGVIHRDLKPGNLMVTPHDTVKIMDFGLARQVIPSQSKDDTLQWPPAAAVGLSGTPGYMAPEQARSEPTTPATDVFSLGLIIYEMLTGKPAISGKGVLDTLRRVEQFDAAPYLDELPDRFAEVLRLALANNSADRPGMDQVAEQLEYIRA